MNWLITGGCGFLGRSLIKKLLNEGDHSITVVDNLSVGSRKDLEGVCDYQEVTIDKRIYSPGLVQLVVGDITDADLALDLCEHTDIIVHLAANTGVGPSVENPRVDCLYNVIGTFNYLEGAREKGVKRFVFASSGAPAGECDPPIHEELPPHPVSPYGASKLAGEGYCSAYYRTFGVETVALRFSNVYGPLSSKKDSVVAKFIKKIMNKEVLEVYGDGCQTRDFIYIDDLIRAIVLAATQPEVGGETFQIAAAAETTILELIEQLTDAAAQANVAENISYFCSEPRLGDVKRNFSDTSKAKKMLGWQAETDLASGLPKTIEWFLKQKA